jgi:hypothetical protein
MAGDIVNMPVASNPDFMRLIVEMEDVIRGLELDLKRKRIEYKFDETTGTNVPVIVSYGKPRISDEGLQDILAEVRSFLNPNTPYSYTSTGGEDFNGIMKVSCKAFAIRLWVKMKDWGVEPSDYLVICDKVRVLKELALRKTIGANFANFSASSRQSSETHIYEEQQKGGILGGIFGQPKKPPQY